MGRLRANFARLGNPMQDYHLGKEPCVTLYAVRPLGWNSMVRGDFGASLRCARNNSSARAIVLYIAPSGGRRLRIAAEPPVQFSGPTGRLISDSLSADCLHSSNLNSQIYLLLLNLLPHMGFHDFFLCVFPEDFRSLCRMLISF